MTAHSDSGRLTAGILASMERENQSNWAERGNVPAEKKEDWGHSSKYDLSVSFSTEATERLRRSTSLYDRSVACSSLISSTSQTKYIDPSDDRPQARWLSSLLHSDPRWQIAKYFDEVATKGRPGRGSFCDKTVFRKKANIFTVWRPTSKESIKNMIRRAGTGKGMDVKGKSARDGNISSYVPFVQISSEEHKEKIQASHLADDGTVRVYYDNEGGRDGARRSLMMTKASMLFRSKASVRIWKKIDGGLAVSEAEQELAVKHRRNNKDNLRLDVVDDFAPAFYGIDVSERLFWQGYVMEQDCSRPEGTEWFINRGSNVYNMNNNFKSTRKAVVPGERRVVVYQTTVGEKEGPSTNPMEPRTLLVAYEENGTILPVVSDFDLFLLGSRGLDYNLPISEDHLELMQWLLRNIRQVFEEQKRSGERIEWSESWPDVIRRSAMINGYYPETPPYGHGDPVLYDIISHAASRLKANGCVRHGPECFNLHFPQDIDEEFLVVCDALPGNVRSNVPWKYMNVPELQELLMDMIDDGFTFPINPKWVLCDPGWKRVWDKLATSDDPNVRNSLDCWFPPGTNTREEIEAISAEHPNGLNVQVPMAGVASGNSAVVNVEKRKPRKSTLLMGDEKALLMKIRSATAIVQAKNHMEVMIDKENNGDELELKNQAKEKMQAAGVALRTTLRLKDGLEELKVKNQAKEKMDAARTNLQRRIHLKVSLEELESRRQAKESAVRNMTLLKMGLGKMIVEKARDSALDLRRQILNCFDQAAQENSGQGSSENVEIFTVWFDNTPEEAIKKMMLGMGSGKGADIRTSCATRGNIKSYIPFTLSCEDKHKEMLLNSLRCDQIFRVFYPSKESRLEAFENLLLTKERMLYDMRLLNDAYSEPTEEDLFMGGRMCNDANLRAVLVDDHAPDVYGLEVSERLLWEAYVMQRDCSRPEGSEWDVGIRSPVAYAQMNIDTLQKWDSFISPPKDTHPVLYQIKENSPMEPRTLVMAYEEHGDVRPVVDGFECFLFGTRGVHFGAIEKKQVELMQWSVQNVEEFLRKQKATKQSLGWIETWHESLQAKRGSLKPHLPVPQYGTSGPISYRIFESAIESLQDTGAGCVRHAAECYNLISPKPPEDRFVVISNTLPGDTPWKHVNVGELQDLLCAKIDEGFAIPLNPKWILCDPGWKKVYDKLLGSDNPDIRDSVRCWFPPESGIRDDIERIWNEYSCKSLSEEPAELSGEDLREANESSELPEQESSGSAFVGRQEGVKKVTDAKKEAGLSKKEAELSKKDGELLKQEQEQEILMQKQEQEHVSEDISEDEGGWMKLVDYVARVARELAGRMCCRNKTTRY